MRREPTQLHQTRLWLLIGILGIGFLVGSIYAVLAHNSSERETAEKELSATESTAKPDTSEAPDNVGGANDPSDDLQESEESEDPAVVETVQVGNIRVLIKTSSYADLLHETLTVTADTDYRILYGEGFSAEEVHDAGERVELTPESAYFTDGTVRIESLEEDGRVLLPDVARSEETEGYRGFLDVTVCDGGLAVVNELSLEEYLYAVVPSEMPASYGAEALKAQAVCARTYAAYYLTNAAYPEYSAHVDDSTSFQVYHNISEQEATNAAVDATCGQVLTDADGELIRTYYYSTSCGLGSTAYQAETLRDEETFAAFITSVPSDAYESGEAWFRWTYTIEELDVETVYARMLERYETNPTQVRTWLGRKRYSAARAPQSFTEITSIEIAKRSDYGAAAELIIETDSGTYQIRTENAIRTILCDGETAAVRQHSSSVSMPNLVPSGFFILTVDKEGENVVGYRLTGGGFGHGNGLSQNAAKAMAALGYTWEEILAAFYRNCSVTALH